METVNCFVSIFDILYSVVNMNKFVLRLTELLNSCGKMQKEVSNDLGISKQKLSKWKTGYNEPSIDEIIKLSNYFNVSSDYLLGIKDD